MGRTILADDNIQAYVEKLLRTNSWYLGILIGKLTSQKDYAVHIVRTPEPVEDIASDDDEEEEEGAEAVKQKEKKMQSKPKSMEEMNEQWAATHAKQVQTMLPGGLNVIGIFALAPPAMMQSSQAKLRQILFAIQKLEKKSGMEGMSDSISDRVLLQICSSTRKLTCRTIDVQDPKSSFRPADWKYLATSEKWNRLDADLTLDLPVDIPQRSATSNLSKQIQTGLQPFCRRLWNGLVLLNGSMRQETEPLNQSVADRKSKGRDKGQTDQQTYKCNILVGHCDQSVPVLDPSIDDYSTRVMLRGTIHCRAYVVGKATVEEAQQAVKTDAMRSVLSRCELLCDDIQVVEEDAEKPEVYTMPRRVFFRLPGTSIELCDYMFQDEKPREVTSRVAELLDISVTEDEIDLDSEKAATEDDICELLTGDIQEDSANEDKPAVSGGLKYYIMAGVGGAVALVTALLMMFEET